MIASPEVRSALSRSSRAGGLICMLVATTWLPVQAAETPAKPTAAHVEGGRMIGLSMTGELAEKYARETGTIPPKLKAPQGLQISILAIISRRLPNGQYEIEHTRTYQDSEGKSCLLTLTSNVEANRIVKTVTPKGTLVYSSPVDTKPVKSQKDQIGLRLELSDLQGLKLQTWSLKESIGN